ncbi:methyltransferase domain-containing protein [Thermanaerovibrio velox]|uniref:methyltransferase domain-containing protein n=1 Tax=Thermanaerovibrio velox TaxID=108007 RepID=UPI00067FF5EE|nr:methyltransferase domain-containing protein [Thermanaerovibrio velox]
MTFSDFSSHGAREIKEKVRKRYAENLVSRSCCGSCGCGGLEAITEGNYGEEHMSVVPQGAEHVSFGCGNPVEHADLMPGERVLDLGCGTGLDALLAAVQVGPEGSVVGLDMTPQMIERARSNRMAWGLDNVEFLLGEDGAHTPAGSIGGRGHLQLRDQPFPFEGGGFRRVLPGSQGGWAFCGRRRGGPAPGPC